MLKDSDKADKLKQSLPPSTFWFFPYLLRFMKSFDQRNLVKGVDGGEWGRVGLGVKAG